MFEPDKRAVKDLRKWREVFWTYHHLRPECLRPLAEQSPFCIDEVQVDIAPKAKRMKESAEERDAATEVAKRQLCDAFADLMPSRACTD